MNIVHKQVKTPKQMMNFGPVIPESHIFFCRLCKDCKCTKGHFTIWTTGYGTEVDELFRTILCFEIFLHSRLCILKTKQNKKKHRKKPTTFNWGINSFLGSFGLFSCIHCLGRTSSRAAAWIPSKFLLCALRSCCCCCTICRVENVSRSSLCWYSCRWPRFTYPVTMLHQK